MKGLQGKVAIVPGGATKIGQAVVQAFTDAGVRVMVADIAAEAGHAMERDGVAFQACDLRDDAQIADLVKATKSRFGRIDWKSVHTQSRQLLQQLQSWAAARGYTKFNLIGHSQGAGGGGGHGGQGKGMGHG